MVTSAFTAPNSILRITPGRALRALSFTGLSINVSSLQVGLNEATNASPLDWTKDLVAFDNVHSTWVPQTVSVLDPLGTTHTFAFTTGVDFEVSGSASIDLAGLLAGSASFSFTRQTIASVVLPNGGGTLTNPVLLTFGLSNLQLAVGTTSIGAQIGGSGSTLTLAVLTPAAATNESRTWFGLTGTGLAASLILPDITATVSGLEVEVNEASGQDPHGVVATPLNWGAVSSTIFGSLTLSGPQLNADGDLTNLSIFGILSGSAHVSFARQTVDVAPSPTRPRISQRAAISGASEGSSWPREGSGGSLGSRTCPSEAGSSANSSDVIEPHHQARPRSHPRSYKLAPADWAHRAPPGVAAVVDAR